MSNFSNLFAYFTLMTLHIRIQYITTTEKTLSLKYNTRLQARSPKMNLSESFILCKNRSYLAILRCSHHLAFLTYEKKPDSSMSDASLGCNTVRKSIKKY